MILLLVLGLFKATIIIGSTAVNAAVPLLFELACEISYPVGEGITNGVVTVMNNIAGLIFLFIMMIPNISKLIRYISKVKINK